MLKKLLALLLMLALCPITAVHAEAPFPLYHIVSRDETGQDTLLGSGVLQITDTLLLTVESVCQAPGALYAIDSEGGEHPVIYRFLIDEESGLAILSLENSAGTNPLDIAPPEGPLFCLGLRQDGTAVSVPASHVTAISLNSLPCLLFSAEADLLPGSILLDENGSVAGITTAVYSEGEGRYAALTSTGIYTLLIANQKESLAENVSWLTNVSTTLKDGQLLVDWSNYDSTALPADSVFKLFFAIEGNPYYSCMELDSNARTVALPAVPGHNLQFWLLHTAYKDQAALPDEQFIHSVYIPDERNFTLYGYKDSVFYLGTAPSDKPLDETAAAARLDPITVQTLSDPANTLYLQAASWYPALDIRREANLLFVLTTPEDYVFFQEAMFIFDPSLVLKDVWHADITSLFADYLSLNDTGAFAPGTYTLSYYLDGALANQLAFTLE